MSAFPTLTIGCSRVGSLGNEVPMATVRETLRRAAEAGITAFDTANIYGQGDSERTLGALFGGRADVAIVTKAGHMFSRKAVLAARFKWALRPLLRLRRKLSPLRAAAPASADAARAAQISDDFSPAALVASLDDSLHRLQRGSVAAFLLHDPSASVIADPAVIAAMQGLRAAGKAVRIGVSLNTPGEFAAAASAGAWEVVQAPLDLLQGQQGSPAYAALLAQGAAIHVRQVLRQTDGSVAADIPAAIARARGLPGVESVLVGVSQPAHLAALVAHAT